MIENWGDFILVNWVCLVLFLLNFVFVIVVGGVCMFGNKGFFLVGVFWGGVFIVVVGVFKKLDILFGFLNMLFILLICFNWDGFNGGFWGIGVIFKLLNFINFDWFGDVLGMLEGDVLELLFIYGWLFFFFLSFVCIVVILLGVGVICLWFFWFVWENVFVSIFGCDMVDGGERIIDFFFLIGVFVIVFVCVFVVGIVGNGFVCFVLVVLVIIVGLVVVFFECFLCVFGLIFGLIRFCNVCWDLILVVWVVLGILYCVVVVWCLNVLLYVLYVFWLILRLVVCVFLINLLIFWCFNSRFVGIVLGMLFILMVVFVIICFLVFFLCFFCFFLYI